MELRIVGLYFALGLKLELTSSDELFLGIGTHFSWNLKILEGYITESRQHEHQPAHLVKSLFISHHFLDLGLDRCKFKFLDW